MGKLNGLRFVIFFCGSLLGFSALDPFNALFIEHRLSPEFIEGIYTGGCSPSVASSLGPK